MAGLKDERPARSAEGALSRRPGLATAGLVSGVLGATALVFGLVLYALDPDVAGLTVGNTAFGVVALFFYAITNKEALGRALAARSTPYLLLELLIGLGVVALMVALNYLAHGSKQEWDLTQDRLHSLEPQSVEVARRLATPVRVVAFLRPGEPARNALVQLLELYGRETRQLRAELVHPDAAPPELVKELGMGPSSPRIALVAERDGRRQIAKIRAPTEDLLTTALLKVAERPPRKLYLLAGHGEADPSDEGQERGLGKLRQRLFDEGYQVEALTLAGGTGVPADATALLVPQPQRELLPDEAAILQGYLERGGRALFLLEPLAQAPYAPMLSGFGLEVGEDLVIDPASASKAAGFGPDALVLQRLEPHPITTPLEKQAVFLFQARRVSPRLGQEGQQVTTLAQSSPASWAETRFAQGTQELKKDELDYPGPVPLAAVVTRSTAGVRDQHSGEARLVVIGDQSLATNRFLAVGGNADLLLNAVGWLSGEESKISLRPKARGSSRIPLTEAQTYWIMFFSVNLLPLSIIGVGFSVWAVRRRK